MRALALVIVLLAAWPAQAAAQQDAAEAAALDPQAAAAAADLYQAIIFDSGALDIIVHAAFQMHGPSMRETTLSAPFYRDLSPDHQRAVMTFVDTLPTLVREEVSRAMRGTSDRAVPRLAGLMSPEHLTTSAAFLRSPDMGEAWKDLVRQVMEDDGSSGSGAFPDLMGTPQGRAFAATPAGAALARQRDAIDIILSDAGEMALAQLEARLQTLFAEGMCAAMEEECPAPIRNAIGRT